MASLRQSATQKMVKIIKMIETLTSYSLEDEMDEAQLRNTALVKMHGHMPSYSLWDADSVGDEQSCLRWWKEVFSELELGKLDEETMMWFWRIGKSIVRHELDGVLQRALKLANSVSDELDMLDALSDEETEWTGAQETEDEEDSLDISICDGGFPLGTPSPVLRVLRGEVI